ncbi:hypothetical protein [Vulcanisaeta sp. JCM 16161]|uniref:hypothetical protein n=1 Tax=Vulcanisaeta sp. JCM 16161 TaxID=1295372 RepID=UPI0006D1CD21|nr:hypothetical protein [Vulcanisaeta sp. JCM 16161]
MLKSVDGYVVSAVDEVWRSLNKPLDALALISARFGALRLIERDLTTLVVGEALRELLNRHGPLTNVKVMINNSVVRPEEVLKLDDYADVVIATNGESTFVKAWVVKELLRAMGSVRT